ncbi:MAG: acyl-CoA dehydrogenase C-terminal domain-containing protein [Kangiellaceae bacterium]|jgi:alkylation response protein AidB-like acyl-CoA dehydrogenase|nr:acyl-CoA dehydrogenase C-terminal domain-containing protein [Kangiellaceae bacterium]
MHPYKAPVEDIRFILHDWLNITEHYQNNGFEEAADEDLINAILEEGAKFTQEALAPINQSGDQQGCRLEDGVVTTPEGFKQAYQQYCENGWPGLACNPNFGGQGLPYSLSFAVSEMVSSANMSWGMYPGLSQGAIEALDAHGSEHQQQTYLPNLIAGTWTGTMCLTESHCGSDLGMLKTKAEPNADGTYNITGTKIFISAGEHDMSENIIHLVLARLPDAPSGTKGISLFIVPKFIVNDDGSLGDRNAVTCGSIEHKMGIKASATAVLNFDQAKGYLIGEANKGLNYMFTMMNAARLGTGQQGIAQNELGYQASLAYAKDRIQMRSLSGVKAPDKAADPIIVHPDVRRMLLTQKAFAEGNRALSFYVASLVDAEHKLSGEEQVAVSKELSFLTPICKAFMTETGSETANLAMQTLGGHGYINEWGIEQIVRDVRISLIYEGTNGIQALDLLGRKVLGDRLVPLQIVTGKIAAFCQTVSDESLAPMVETLGELNEQWLKLTMATAQKAQANPDEVGAAAFDYLMFSGYVYLAYVWLQLAVTAQQVDSDEKLATSKLKTCQFYFQRLLPRAHSHAQNVLSGADVLMSIDEDLF